MITLSDGSKKVRLEEFGFKPLADHSNSSSGSFNRKLQYIPGRFAPWDFGVEQKGKSMEIPCKSLHIDEGDFEEQLNKFNAFVLDDNKSPKTLKMSYDYEPDKFYYVQLEGAFDPDRSSILKGLSIPFFAGDSNKYASSNAYDSNHKIIYGQVEKGDYYPNTQSFQWIYSRHYSGIYNYSAFTTDIKITIAGTIKSGKVTHTQSGKALTFPDITNGKIVLNSDNRTVEKNGTALFDGSNYEFFKLASGNNSFIFEGDTTNAKVTFDWVHRF